MDKSQEEMKFVGFFGIFKEAFKTIFSWKKLFTQITLTLVLPLTLIFLAQSQISRHIFWRIEQIPFAGFEWDTSVRGEYLHRYSDVPASDWAYYWLFKAAYFTLLLAFSLLSTAAVVYTMACLYTGRDVTFGKTFKVIPKVWKRLVVTFLCTYLAFFLYNVVSGVVLLIWFVGMIKVPVFNIVSIVVIVILYVLGFLYLTLVWQLGSVVTVLENASGFKAMKKGMQLAKGKKAVGMGIFFVLYCILMGVLILFLVCVESAYSVGVLWRVILGILSVVLLVWLFMYSLVVQTVLYLVCKSHHREVIDKLSLATKLGSYLGESQPAFQVSQDIQLGRPQV